MKDAQEKFKANMPAAQEEYESIMSLGETIMEKGGGVENPYTNITVQVNVFLIQFLIQPYIISPMY